MFSRARSKTLVIEVQTCLSRRPSLQDFRPLNEDHESIDERSTAGQGMSTMVLSIEELKALQPIS